MHVYTHVCIYIYINIKSCSAHSRLTYSYNNGERSPRTANIHFGRVRGWNVVARIIIMYENKIGPEEGEKHGTALILRAGVAYARIINICVSHY